MEHAFEAITKGIPFYKYGVIFEEDAMGFQQAGKKEGGQGEGIFDRSICPAKRDKG